MTAATLPDVDLEAWFAGEIEQPCEVTNFGRPCPAAADWLVVFKAQCAHGRKNGFICDDHKKALDGVPLCCRVCGTDATFIWTERIRSPR